MKSKFISNDQDAERNFSGSKQLRSPNTKTGIPVHFQFLILGNFYFLEWKDFFNRFSFNFIHWLEYDRDDSFLFDFEPNGNPFSSKSKVKTVTPIIFQSIWLEMEIYFFLWRVRLNLWASFLSPTNRRNGSSIKGGFNWAPTITVPRDISF